MASLTDDDLDGVSEGRKYPDGTVIRVFCMRTDRDAYSSGWAYKLHYGATEPDRPARFTMVRFVGTTTRTRTPKSTNCTSHRTPTQT